MIEKPKHQEVQAAVKALLQSLRLDLSDPDLKDTPKRMANLFIKELERPDNLSKILQVFPARGYASAVTCCNHRAYTRCPHHLERVIMDVSVSYIPNGQLLGLSKLPRIINYFSSGLMLQEEVAEMIVEGLNNALQPKGVACHIEAQHMCMQARGVKAHNATVKTTRLTGIFKDDPAAREEFFWTIKN